VAISLVLTAAGMAEDDIPLIQTIGLLPDKFSPLVV
jgi:hypothetical protein